MKKSPLNFLNKLGAISASITGGGGNMAPAISSVLGGLLGRNNRVGVSRSGLAARVGRLEQQMAELGLNERNSGVDDSIKSVQEDIVNPPSSTIPGNIQPNAYNATGFSSGMVDNANQIFNTPEERNKII